MWIIRFGKLQTKDYNKISRLLKKSGFVTRRIAPIVYAKSLISHELQKKSWRQIALQSGVSHIGLHKFHTYIKNSPEYNRIFHVFLESRCVVFVGDNSRFTQDDLDNSREIYTLTKNRLESIL